MVNKQDSERPVQNAAAQPVQRPAELAMEQVFREHASRVMSAAYRVTGNAQDAEDVLQTVFLRLSRREGGSPLSDSPGSYLHRASSGQL